MAYDSGGETEPIKVFLSYSRADTGFALELVNALQACGFEAFIDQEDIAPGEPWEQRLGGLIESADTVVYILSPDSLTSEHCSWEVEETQRLNKRLIPVVWRPVPDGQVPKELSQLNYVFFDGDKSFAAGLKDLSAALRVDHQWIREHTRLGALARRWDGRGRTDALLLRGDELEAASNWMASRPHGAPAVSDDQMDFISSSKAAADAAERAARNRRRGLLIGVSAVAVAMAGLAGFSGLQWLEAEEAKAFAQEAYQTAVETNDQLEGALIRLSSDIALRAPSTGRDPFETKGGWFPVAANYAGAVVRLQKGRQIVTGILIDGAMVHPDWAGTPYVLTPRFKSEEELIAEDRRLNEFLAATDAMGAEGADDFEGERFSRAFIEPAEGGPPPGVIEQSFVRPGPMEIPPPPPPEPNLDDDAIDHSLMEQRYLTPEELMPEGAAGLGASPADDPASIEATFPTLRDSPTLALVSKPVWRTPIELSAEPVFFIHALEGDVPFGARPLQPGDIDCERDPWGSSGGGRFALFGIDGAAATGTADANPGRFMSNVFIEDEQVPPVSDGTDTEELTLLVTSGLDVAGSEGVTYRHATLKGAFGAPVFDLDSRKVIAIHQGVDANRMSADGRVGFAEPIVPLIELIREDVSIDLGDEQRTPPLCEPR
ncbi:MAG: toll/interleukin-1 receptor domain-containing protein [Pseudomonadota bacterium]